MTTQLPTPLPLASIPPTGVAAQPPADRQARLDRMQALQTEVARFQHAYRDSQPEFWALRLAWEAVRFAWYILAGDADTAAAKLALVKDAIKDCERH